ncbi:Energy-coupling factor transporter ATP-binding protein EcfA 2 [[Clostridium] ultunense Esp]|uniref:Energizing coupling factor of ABC influx transporter (ATP-binding protein) n=2 Tax=Schnuerera ultunensis TaxID=45497 RepID=M1Z7F1_9FIRM|nr:Energy-coupling factor transporter ATP-binding protein EcfA 2 [[Clostridium] ultunense Esp]SHD75450.1 energizing coupling factor of ABC influx transporter (ATP-binding protein) [[Clostridium] ultunense Esp]
MVDEMIRIENVTYEYSSIGEDSQLMAIKDVNISIDKGEYLVILGHNGSGKSTLAKLMNGLLLPTRGNVYVNNMNTKDEDKIWNIRETAGMVFQNPDNQIVATIVEEDVAFGPENQGVPPLEIRERVDEALRIVEMEEYKKHAPHLLSGGQKQRVAIAGILAMKPECIILDEPTAMLDPTGRIEIINTIRKLNKEEKKTIIHITHFMDEAVEADRILVMEQGEIVMEGSPREIFSQVKKVKNLGLDVPQVTELAYELRREGFNVPVDILTIEELVKAL